jgi:hypothetical protein
MDAITRGANQIENVKNVKNWQKSKLSLFEKCVKMLRYLRFCSQSLQKDIVMTKTFLYVSQDG